MKILKQNGFWYFMGILGFLILWGMESPISNFLKSPFPPGHWLLHWYPSLEVKRQAWGTAGLIEILSQVKFRFLALFGLGLFLFRFARTEENPFFTEKKAIWMVKLFFILQLLFVPDLLMEIRIRAQWKALFQPEGISGFWLGSFPSYPLVQFLAIVLFGISAWLVLSRWEPESPWPLLAACLVFLIWGYLLSAFFGFGKIDHTYASMFSGMMGMILFLQIWRSNSLHFGFGYRIFQAFIWGCYFFSGLEKVFLSGLNWANQEHLQVLAALHPGFWADKLVSLPFAHLLLWPGLFFQLLSVLQWRWPNWGYVTVAAGIFFHLGTYLLIGVGGYFSPWMAMLIFLLPHSRRW
jgi:hypothetical protein